MFFYHLCVAFIRVVTSATFPESEYLTLYDLYNSTNGAHWKWSNQPMAGIPWSFTAGADPCADKWQGVTCINTGTPQASMYHVSQLIMNRMNLAGSLPESIGALPMLQDLELYSNQLNGTIPSSVGNLTNLLDLDLDTNNLVGHIPDSIGNLTKVVEFNLGSNDLTGPIPYSIGNLVNLQILDLYGNKLTGSIPSSICNLTNLVDLALDSNLLTGHILDCLGNLIHLQTLSLYRNALCGFIPSTIGNLTDLVFLALEDNDLTGHIPDSIGNLNKLDTLALNLNALAGSIPYSIGNSSQLQNLYLSFNALTGSIPSSIGNLANLAVLDLGFNELTGYIPTFLGNLVNLEILVMSNNQLRGQIPSVGNLVNLQQFIVDNNQLTGLLPDSIGNLVHLLYLYFDNNELTGPVPDSVGDLAHLLGLNISVNKLSGRIPDSLGAMKYLGDIDLNDNHFTGSMPASIGDLAELFSLDLSSNQLTGSIPKSVANLSYLQSIKLGSNLLSGSIPAWQTVQLQYCDLSANMLTGTLPADNWRNLSTLTELILSNNKLSGPISHVFSTLQTVLISVQLEGNQFTGTLPAVLFDLPALTSISMVGSCLHGSLPDNICNATQLEALILYGLTTGTSCRSTGVQSLSQSHHAIGGTVPACVLELPKLVTILMAGNGFTGSIARNITLSETLLQLDLSHNSLSGTIPDAIQSHSWLLLDLSHNKLSGVLDANLLVHSNASKIHNMTSNSFFKRVSSEFSAATLSLLSNRLSGPVPNSVKPLHNNLSVLAGNLFECRYDKSDLPQHDSGINTYECASNSFDLSIYVWLGLCLCVVGAGVYHRSALYRIAVSVLAFQLPEELSSKLSHLCTLFEDHQALCKCAWYCAAFCLMVLLPYYAIVSVYQGTHTHQYAYAVSAIYVSGVVPFVFTTLLLAVLLGAAVHCAQIYTPIVSTADSTIAQSDVLTYQRWCVIVIFAFSNITFVLGANIAFVYVVLYQSSQLQTLVQILLSLFKLGWSMVVSPYMMRQLCAYFLTTAEQADGPVESFFTLQLLVSLFNNIAIPCLVVAAIDPNCFSNILLPPDTETVHILNPVCNYQDRTCIVEYELSPAQFTPPFTYSYQCSASFITSYAPTFVYMAVTTAFISPLLQYALVRLLPRVQANSALHQLFMMVLPRLLQPPVPGIPSHAAYQLSPLLGAVGVLVTLLTQLGILLTFGAIFPPVALAMAVSISAVVFMTRYKVQRYVHAVVETQQLPVLDMINAECERVGMTEQMRTAVVIIICYCCAFYAMFLFDTLGDAVGFAASVWVLIVVPLAPWVIFGSIRVYRSWSEIRSVGETAVQGANGGVVQKVQGVELVTMSATSKREQVVVENEGTVNILHSAAV